MTARSRNRSNNRLALGLGGVVVAMVALSFAAVPLYRIFCQVTGFGGTTQVAQVAPGATGDRLFKIRFNADVNPELDWAFQPQQREMTVQMGEAGLAFYRAENRAEQAVTRTASCCGRSFGYAGHLLRRPGHYRRPELGGGHHDNALLHLFPRSR
jgi:cytochrome c oxidase assembly protein subunit 11